MYFSPGVPLFAKTLKSPTSHSPPSVHHPFHSLDQNSNLYTAALQHALLGSTQPLLRTWKQYMLCGPSGARTTVLARAYGISPIVVLHLQKGKATGGGGAANMGASGGGGGDGEAGGGDMGGGGL